MPRQSYSLFFWGLLVAILDIHLGDFDVLPDFVGYLLISWAAARISSTSPAFRKAIWPAAALAVLDVFGYFAARDEFRFLGEVGTILDCILIWLLLGAVAIDCAAHGHRDLVASAHSRRRWYVGISLGMYVVLFFTSGSPGLSTVLVVVGAITVLVLLVLVLSLLRTARLRLFGR